MISPNPDFADSESGAVAREKAADKVLEENLELHRRLNLTPTVLAVIEPDGRYNWVNDVILQYFGLSAAVILGDLRREVVHPDDFQRIREERQRALASGLPFEYENRLRRHDGQYRWFLVRYQPLKDAAGRVVRWYASATDIEDRKRAEEALRRSEAYLAEAQSLSHTGSWAFDISTREMIHTSAELSRLYGFDPEAETPSFGELIQRIHPEDQAPALEALESASRVRKDFDYQYRIVLPNGTTRHVYGTAHPVFNSSGDFTGFVGVVMDITDRKRAEEARLEERVRERTRIARELHDTLLQSFQAPLLYFQTAINLLQEHPDEARKILESALDHAQQAVAEGRDAIKELRAEIAVRDLPVAIRTLGEELAADETNRSSAVFDVAVVGTVREVHPALCDEAYRIVSEALRNAFRHARAQKIEVTIRYDEKQFGVRVRDDGKGIDPKFLGGDGREGHYGLQGMRERAKLVGGQLTILSGLVSGTEIKLSIPASTAYVSTGSALEPDRVGSKSPPLRERQRVDLSPRIRTDSPLE